MADAQYEHPRLASIYDRLDPDRKDLDVYAAFVVDEFVARTVLDVGCGTGTFACLLARRGLVVVGSDPAAASLDVARTKPGADRVRWIHGDLTAWPPMQLDVATMTGNVAQAIVTDDEWMTTLGAIGTSLRPLADDWSLRAECPRTRRGAGGRPRKPRPSGHTGHRDGRVLG